jgi:tetratricopeptide (TPR) repeat protein
LARERAIERYEACAERGYLLVPEIERKLGAGEWRQAWAMATEAAELAERFDDPDLLACARHLQGRALIGQGELPRGVSLLDEAMLVVTAGRLSPVLTGLLYCSVIDVCQQMGIVARAREWTNALAQWCEEQPDMLAFSGTCYVHRAEILQLQGAWEQAIAEAERACERCLRIRNRSAAAAAFYRRAEVHSLRGEFADAEEMYRAASQWVGIRNPVWRFCGWRKGGLMSL